MAYNTRSCETKPTLKILEENLDNSEAALSKALSQVSNISQSTIESEIKQLIVNLKATTANYSKHNKALADRKRENGCAEEATKLSRKRFDLVHSDAREAIAMLNDQIQALGGDACSSLHLSESRPLSTCSELDHNGAELSHRLDVPGDPPLSLNPPAQSIVTGEMPRGDKIGDYSSLFLHNHNSQNDYSLVSPDKHRPTKSKVDCAALVNSSHNQNEPVRQVITREPLTCCNPSQRPPNNKIHSAVECRREPVLERIRDFNPDFDKAGKSLFFPRNDCSAAIPELFENEDIRAPLHNPYGARTRTRVEHKKPTKYIPSRDASHN